MALIDIIIPLYNKTDTVERTIHSIQSQTLSDWSIIVVDDGSTDDGPDKVKRIQDDRITVICQENAGPGAARNRGIREATADYIAFLDADDQWYPWYLENAMKAFQGEDIAMVGSMYYEWPKQIDMTQYWARQNVIPGMYRVDAQDDPEQIESWILFFHVGTTVVKRNKALQYDGFYDKDGCRYGEDTIFFARLALNEAFRIIGPAAVRHNRQDSGLSHQMSRPLSPILQKPEIILDYCPDNKIQPARLFLARLALRTAHGKARNGYKQDAVFLVQRFPEMNIFSRPYRKLLFEIKFSKPVLGPIQSCHRPTHTHFPEKTRIWPWNYEKTA